MPHLTVAAVVERDGRFLFVEETAGGARVLNQPAQDSKRVPAPETSRASSGRRWNACSSAAASLSRDVSELIAPPSSR
jgi:hypothetical protein